MLTRNHGFLNGFLLMWLFIVFISVHDGYLVLCHRPIMHMVEQNPAGRWLLERSGGDIWLLLALKAFGTLCAASLLLVLHSFRPRLGWTACAATALFQLFLLLYLYFA
jgi:hypothetical protein